MIRSLIFALLLVSVQPAFAGGCKAPEQGPRGPRGPQGETGVQLYGFFYTLTDQIVPGGEPSGDVNQTVVGVEDGCRFGVVEFDQNKCDPEHVNINHCGFILHKDDCTNPKRITAIEVPRTGDYQIIFNTIANYPCQAFGLADTTNSCFFCAANCKETATVKDFCLLNPGSISTESTELVLNCIVHLEKGTLLSIVNILGKDIALCPKDVKKGPGSVVAAISLVFLGSGDCE